MVLPGWDMFTLSQTAGKQNRNPGPFVMVLRLRYVHIVDASVSSASTAAADLRIQAAPTDAEPLRPMTDRSEEINSSTTCFN